MRALAMQSQSTSCGMCRDIASGVTVSRTRSGVIEPAASDDAAVDRSISRRCMNASLAARFRLEIWAVARA